MGALLAGLLLPLVIVVAVVEQILYFTTFPPYFRLAFPHGPVDPVPGLHQALDGQKGTTAHGYWKVVGRSVVFLLPGLLGSGSLDGALGVSAVFAGAFGLNVLLARHFFKKTLWPEVELDLMELVQTTAAPLEWAATTAPVGALGEVEQVP